MNYRKHFAEMLKVDPKAIFGFTPKDGDHTNCSLSNLLLIIDPKQLEGYKNEITVQIH